VRLASQAPALLGSWGREGGFYIPQNMAVPTLDPHHHPETNGAIDRPAPSDYPLADAVLAKGVCDASIPGHVREDSAIKGWMVYGSNLPTTLPNPAETQAALEALDFVVTIDVLPVEMVGWSDVVLPEATYLERDDDLNAPWYRQGYVGLRQAAVSPMTDRTANKCLPRRVFPRIPLFTA